MKNRKLPNIRRFILENSSQTKYFIDPEESGANKYVAYDGEDVYVGVVGVSKGQTTVKFKQPKAVKAVDVGVKMDMGKLEPTTIQNIKREVEDLGATVSTELEKKYDDDYDDDDIPMLT